VHPVQAASQATVARVWQVPLRDHLSPVAVEAAVVLMVVEVAQRLAQVAQAVVGPEPLLLGRQAQMEQPGLQIRAAAGVRDRRPESLPLVVKALSSSGIRSKGTALWLTSHRLTRTAPSCR
jgi:hypothetical protein